MFLQQFLQSHSGPSSAIGFSPDMVHAQMLSSQQGLIQSALSASLDTPNANAFRRAMNSQLNSVSGGNDLTHVYEILKEKTNIPSFS